MRRFHALCFDLDRTLLDGSRFGEAIEQTCRRLTAARPELDTGRLLAANADAFRAYWPRIEAQWTLGTTSGAAVSREIWRRTLRTCGIEDATLVEVALETQLNAAPQTYRPYDDVADLFARLERARVPLALVTNGASDAQREKLHGFGLANRFDALVISGDHGIAKPDPAIFALAIAQLGVAPQDIWHVGDNLATDVAGALAAGIGAVWLNRSGAPFPDGAARPDLEIRSLRELIQ